MTAFADSLEPQLVHSVRSAQIRRTTSPTPVPGQRGASPLWMVMREPAVNELIGYLQDARHQITNLPRRPHRLVFSRRQLTVVRAAFASSIRRGEAKLHRLGALMARTIFSSSYDLKSVVIGENRKTGERFDLFQGVSHDELSRQTDLDLGTRLLERIRFRHGQGWARARLIANFVEYQPQATNRYRVHKMISRIKAEEEIWNKVVDEIFDLDALVKRDKELSPLSRYVKDVFGLKIVVDGPADANRLDEVLTDWRWSESQRDRVGVLVDPTTERLHVVERKRYLGDASKQSGWEAIRNVVQWWGHTFEIQVQPLLNYSMERELLTQESHAGFKQRRERLRDQVAHRIPLFAFYRNLLQWLFMAPDASAPRHPGVQVDLVD